MRKIFISLVAALAVEGAFGEVLSNAPVNGTAYTCHIYDGTTSVPIEMVFVKGGTVSSANSDVNGKVVTDFYIGKYEVTQKQWKDVMGSYPATAPSATYGLGDNFPIYYVTWTNAQAFITKLNAMAGNGKFRLPTAAEWEYAAKGGSTPQNSSWLYAGSNTIGNVAWYSVNSGAKAHERGTKTANTIGIHDMTGNVWEWIGSVHPNSTYTNIFFFYGGSFNTGETYSGISNSRDYDGTTYCTNSTGFRLVCSSN